VAAVDGAPGAVLGRERPPGGVGPEHPEHAGEDGARVAGRSADRGAGWEERLHARPRGLGQLGGRRAIDRGGCWLGRGRATGSGSGACASGDVATTGDGLVGAAPAGPAQQEAVPFGRLGEQPEQAADLGHRQRDQRGVGSPPLPPSWVAASRVTSR
jgi:hypothetical protein